MKEKLLVFQKTMLLLVLMLAGATQARAQTNYGLQIIGVDVTSENCNDLSVIPGVSGAVKYVPETKTLYLENATITGGDNSGIWEFEENGLIINVTGENKVTSYVKAIKLANTVTIKGGGTLNAESSENLAIECGYLLEIDSCTVNAKGFNGIKGPPHSHLTIKSNATVTAEGASGSIGPIYLLTLDGCKISEPAGAAFETSQHYVMLNGEIVKSKVVIEKDVPINYNLWLAGVEVTSHNCNDLSVIDGVSGTVKFEPETKTLFLENATIAAGESERGGINNEWIDSLIINVTGENNITAIHPAIALRQFVTIKGSGTLNAESEYNSGIIFLDTLEIDSCTVNAKGIWGIAGTAGTREKLTIRYADVTAEGTEGSICDIASLTLEDCNISTPEGAAFDASKKAVVLNGNTVTDMVVIISDRTVGIKDAKASVPAHKKGIYSIDGVYLGTDFDALPKGIYIKDGKKVKK